MTKLHLLAEAAGAGDLPLQDAVRRLVTVTVAWLRCRDGSS